MALSLTLWARYTKDQVKLQRKSEDTVNSDRVLRFLYDRETGHIEANVQASMKNTSYRVQIDVNDDVGVTFTRCECAMGNFTCHHVASALLFGYKRVSKTDVKCSWLANPKARARKIGEVKPMQELFPPRKPGYSALGRQVTDDDRSSMYTELCSIGRHTALRWILSPERQVVNKQVLPVAIEDVLLSSSYYEAEDKQTYIQEQMELAPGTASAIASQTTGQRTNPLWSVVRKHRVTASNFGYVLSAIERNKYPDSFWKRMFSTYNLDTVRSIAWGVTHESTALASYSALGGRVTQTGIWLHESGVLGASPDGIIDQAVDVQFVHLQTPEAGNIPADLIEIKCPYTPREKNIKDAIKSVPGFFLVEDAGNLKLNEKHNYFHQIQGQLHLLEKECCDLVVWTLVDMVVIRIVKNNSWKSNINRLLEFYFKTLIPHLVE